MLTGDNPITQYRPSPDLIINGTSPGHVFHDGYIVRWLGVDAAGNVSVWTAGLGTNSSAFMADQNRRLGTMIFSTIGANNANSVRYCLEGKASCR